VAGRHKNFALATGEWAILPALTVGPTEPSAPEIIHDKMRLRLLPSSAPVATWVGLGAGRTCDGCDGQVASADLEHEVLLADGAILHFHARCALVLEALRLAL
jgi:hypothetical protein